LDLKKKVKATLEDKVILRLHFAPLNASASDSKSELPSGDKEGYALVSRGDDEELELQRAPLGSDYSPVLATEDASPVDDRRAPAAIATADVQLEEEKQDS
jgi:hypothetical protein